MDWHVLPEGVEPEDLARIQRLSDALALIAGTYYKALVARDLPKEIAGALVADYIRLQLTVGASAAPQRKPPKESL